MSKMNKFQAFRERNRKSNGYLLRKVSFNVAYKIVRFVLLFGLCFLILQPLLNKISCLLYTSFQVCRYLLLVK